MPRFVSWLALAIAAAFLVVVSVSFSLSDIASLAFAISIGTLVVSAGIAYYDRRSTPSLVTALVIAAISAWTIVASLIFSQSTVQNLALGASLAIAGLAGPEGDCLGQGVHVTGGAVVRDEHIHGS